MLTSIVKAFDEYTKQTVEQPEWLRKLQSQALESAKELDFPQRGDEAWKYTNIKPIANLEIELAETVADYDISQLRGHFLKNDINVVFINGSFVKVLYHEKELPQGVHISSLANSLVLPPVKNLIESHQQDSKDIFSLLNLVFLRSGAFIKVSDHTKCSARIHLFYLSKKQKNKKPFAIFNQHFIDVGKAAEVSVVESYLCEDESVYINNVMTHLTLQNAALVKYFNLQLENNNSFHIGRQNVVLEKDARLESFQLDLGGQIARHDLGVAMVAPGADAKLYGLYAVKGKMHVDNHTSIDHRSGGCHSSQLYKGILSEHGRGVFNGKIFIRKDAQLSKSQQLNKNLLLSPDAEVDTKPELQIEADDVQCSHGATISQLNQDELFYCQTRGINITAAEDLLGHGFAGEVLFKVGDQELRNYINQWLEQKFFQVK